MMKQWIPIAIALPLAAACGDAGPEWAGTVDTLASGVIEVSNPETGLWTPGETWTIEEDLRIGSAMAEGPDLFGRVQDIAVDDRGRIHVLDRQATELRTFGPDGSHVRTVGREGGGPGEFRSPIGLAIGPDGRIWVADPGNTRYAVFSPEGEYITSRHRAMGGYAIPWTGGFGPEGRFFEKSFVSGGQVIIRMDSAFQPADTAFYPEYDEPQFTLTTETSRMAAGVPFATSQIETWDPAGYMWTAVTGDYTLTRMDMQGDTLRVIHGPPTNPLPVTDEERERALEALDWFRRQGGQVRPGDIPSEKPPISGLHIDDTGHLWARLTAGPDSHGANYHVFDPDGHFLGMVESPESLGSNPTFRDAAIYGVALDTLGVQYVVRLRLNRGDRSTG